MGGIMMECFKFYGEDKTKRFISHHGIKGQKWGVRRFQNKDGTRTALGKAHASQVRAYKAEKAGKRDGAREGTSAISYYDNALRSLGTAYRWNRADGISRSNSVEYHSAHERNREELKATREALMNRKKFYNDYGDNALENKSGQGANQWTLHRLKDGNGKTYGMAFDTATILGKPGERRISEEEIAQAVKTTNPKFNDGYGWQNNCPACSAALTMKKMGYSDLITASPLADGASSTHGISQWFNGATTEEVGSIENLGSTIASYGKGAFGAIGGSRYATDSEGASVRIGGHSMGFTYLENGKIQVECGQSGKIYGSLKEAAEDQGFAMDRGFTVTRLDNTTPNMVNMAADGVLSTRTKDGYASSSISVITDANKVVDDWDYYTREHGGNHNYW